MKTHKIKLTISLPDFGELLRATSKSLGRLAVPTFQGFRKSQEVEPHPDLEIDETSDLLILDEPSASLLTPMKPLNKAGFSGRVLAVALSPSTLADFAAHGLFGHFRRLVERYSHSFDAVHVLSPDSADFTSRLSVPKVQHLGMPRWLPFSRYSSLVLLPVLHRRALSKVTVVRTFTPHAGIIGSAIRRRTGARVFVSIDPGWQEEAYGQSLITRRVSATTYRRGLDAADEFLVSGPVHLGDILDSHPDTPVRSLAQSVDTGMFCPVRNTDPSAPPTLVFVGHLERSKNLSVLLDALEIASRSVTGLRLAIVGDGSQRYLLENAAESRELPVDFAGAVDHESLPSIYAHAFAYVRVGENQGVSDSLLEAMASGAPCIAPDTPAIRSLITHGFSGLLVPANDPEHVAAAIARLHREPRLRAHLGTEARRVVEARCSLEGALSREVDILLGRDHSPLESTVATTRNGEVAA